MARSGSVQTPEERESRGLARMTVWLDTDARAALDFLAAQLAPLRRLPAGRCRTMALAEAVQIVAKTRGWRGQKKAT